MKDETYSELKNILQTQQRLISELHVKIDQLHRKCDRLEKKSLTTRQEALFNSWRIIDRFDSFLHPSDSIVSCPVCSHSAQKNSYHAVLSQCRFGGGCLERFNCPKCGSIFGPLKMLDLTREELAAEYSQHYALYSEGDSSFFERAAFDAIDQGKDKVYLNWGGGAWSSTMTQLREEGYTIYNYEPFSSPEQNDFVIKDLLVLQTMKFDGIFSNNLLEHLPNPTDEFRLMKTLLRDKEALMLHSTPCFEYAYEYTRFHLIFFTGQAINHIADQTGFSIRMLPKITNGNNFSTMALFTQK